MYEQITIKTLDRQGEKKTAIARTMGCHRNTVGNILKRMETIGKQTRNKTSRFTPHQQTIKELLDKKITRRRIFEILKGSYDLKSQYDALCKYIQKEFPKKVEAFGVQESKPGETAEVDFGYLGMFPGPSGKLVKTFGLAIVLTFSRLGFYAVCFDQKLETLIREVTNAFRYFGGVPKRLKVDNMKTAILKNQHYDLEYNPDFLEFAYHYNTVIVPCTPYRPQEKGTVESGIKYLQVNFIAGRVFTSASDMKGQLRDWMITYANRRIHGTTRKVPEAVFTGEEKEKLQPRPETPFAFFNRGTRTVAQNCHIHFENNYYSVPSPLVGKAVTVRWNEHLLRVIHEGEQVAFHPLAHGIGNYVTLRHHLPDYKVYSETEYQTRFENKMAVIGESAHQYFNLLLMEK